MILLLPREDDPVPLSKVARIRPLAAPDAALLVRFIEHGGPTFAPLAPWLVSSSKAARPARPLASSTHRPGPLPGAGTNAARPFPPPAPAHPLAELVHRLCRGCAAVLEAPAHYLGQLVVAPGLAHANKTRLRTPVPGQRLGVVETAVLVRVDERWARGLGRVVGGFVRWAGG